MKFNVELAAQSRHEGKSVLREVEVPDESILGLIFKYGQNDFQAVPKRCSVSVEDIILYGEERYRVEPMGFSKVT